MKGEYDQEKKKDDILEVAMNEYGNDVYYIVYSYVKNHTVTEDLTQEIFVKLYNNLGSFREDSSLKTWLIRIAINHCKDYFRRMDTKLTIVTDRVHQMIKGKSSTPEQALVHKETQHELSRAVLQLPLKYREIIFLYYFEEMKLTDIAQCMELNINTVKTRLRKGKKLIAKMYEGEV